MVEREERAAIAALEFSPGQPAGRYSTRNTLPLAQVDVAVADIETPRCGMGMHRTETHNRVPPGFSDLCSHCGTMRNRTGFHVVGPAV